MAERKNDFKTELKRLAFKTLRATVKGVLFYALYFVLWIFISPISEFVPNFRQTVETFAITYTILIVLGEFASGTIFKYFLDAAKFLFTISYLILYLKGGLFSISYRNVCLVVDLRLVLTIATLLSLLGFAKSVLQAINFLNEKTEPKYS
ncbi:MAG: hypothetical protein QW270_05085 [Candidatus Bathyarchaeia archaeon]